VHLPEGEFALRLCSQGPTYAGEWKIVKRSKQDDLTGSAILDGSGNGILAMSGTVSPGGGIAPFRAAYKGTVKTTKRHQQDGEFGFTDWYVMTLAVTEVLPPTVQKGRLTIPFVPPPWPTLPFALSISNDDKPCDPKQDVWSY
jgi:hypothetical protein